jgi:hypothetical protein
MKISNSEAFIQALEQAAFNTSPQARDLNKRLAVIFAKRLSPADRAAALIEAHHRAEKLTAAVLATVGVSSE